MLHGEKINIGKVSPAVQPFKLGSFLYQVEYGGSQDGRGGGRLYRVLHSFLAASPKELSLEAGQLVRLAARVDTNWSRGEVRDC